MKNNEELIAEVKKNNERGCVEEKFGFAPVCCTPVSGGNCDECWTEYNKMDIYWVLQQNDTVAGLVKTKEEAENWFKQQKALNIKERIDRRHFYYAYAYRLGQTGFNELTKLRFVYIPE